MNWNLDAVARENAKRALAEDIGAGDLSAQVIPENLTATAEIICRSRTILCGKKWLEECFRALDSAAEFRWQAEEGKWLAPNSVVCIVAAKTRAILSAERCALNFLQTLSGTATQTRLFVDKSAAAVVADTRKTIPGLRIAQKFAVKIGGGKNHRMGLFDEILLKENHLAAAGGIANALAAAKKIAAMEKIQIEVRNLAEMDEAISGGAKRILLDNFSIVDLQKAAASAAAKKCGVELEASGGIDLENIAEISATGVHRASVGGLTKNISAADFSLLIRQ